MGKTKSTSTKAQSTTKRHLPHLPRLPKRRHHRNSEHRQNRQNSEFRESTFMSLAASICRSLSVRSLLHLRHTVFDAKFRYKTEDWKDLGRIETYSPPHVAVKILLTLRYRLRRLRVPDADVSRILEEIVPPSTYTWTARDTLSVYGQLESIGNHQLRKSHIVLPLEMNSTEYTALIFKFMRPDETFFFLRLAASLTAIGPAQKSILLREVETLSPPGSRSKMSHRISHHIRRK